MFEDQDHLPYMPGDEVERPRVGQVVKLKQPTDACGITSGVVTLTFGSLAEDWGPEGESAWAMSDVNEAAGYRGRWYAFITGGENDDVEVVASYEVESVSH